MTVSNPKATEAPRPMSKFRRRVATNVTIQTIWRGGHGQLRHGVPAGTCKSQGRWRNLLKGHKQSPLVGSAPYQVHPVGLPEHGEVSKLLEHALEVDDDDGS